MEIITYTGDSYIFIVFLKANYWLIIANVRAYLMLTQLTSGVANVARSFFFLYYK